MLWTNEKIIQTVQQHHNDFLKTNQKSHKFNYTFLEKQDSRLMSAVQNRKISWKDLIEMSGLDPSCHFGQINYGKTIKDKKRTFKYLIEQYIKEHGIENLNDNNMEDKRIDLPETIYKSKFSKICSKAGCLRFEITSRSIYAEGRRLFSDWGKAVHYCGIDYEEEVLRKVSSFSLLDVLNNFNNWDKQKKGKWIIKDLKSNYALYQQINNSFRNKERRVPFADKYDDRVFTFWMTLNYFKESGKIDFNNDWWSKNFKTLLKKYENNHIGQERWTEEKIISGIQTIYSRGSDTSRLSRDNVIKGEFHEDKTLWGAMRQVRYRGKGKTEEDWLKDSGFILKNLKKLYEELDKPFSLKDCANIFAQLLAESIENDENRLTREYCSKHHKRFCNFIIGEYKSWETGLRKFGLDPKFFSISASKRSKRGLNFQDFVKEMLIGYGFEESSKDFGGLRFASNKLIKGCRHKVKCKPDFNFGNLIIDTKTGYHISSKQDQIERYFAHSGRIIILVLNGKTRVDKIKEIPVEIINFKDFLSNSSKILGVQFDKSESQELTATLKRSPFWLN